MLVHILTRIDRFGRTNLVGAFATIHDARTFAQGQEGEMPIVWRTTGLVMEGFSDPYFLYADTYRIDTTELRGSGDGLNG